MAFATISKFTGWDWSLVTEFKKIGCCNANWWCDCLDLTHKGFQLKTLCLGQACEIQLHGPLEWMPLYKWSAPRWYLISFYSYLNLVLHQQSVCIMLAFVTGWENAWIFRGSPCTVTFGWLSRVERSVMWVINNTEWLIVPELRWWLCSQCSNSLLPRWTIWLGHFDWLN